MSSFLGFSSVSTYIAPVSPAIFFVNIFSLWVSPTFIPPTQVSIEAPVDRIPDIQLRLDAGMSNFPSWAALEGSSLSIFMYFM